MATFGSLNSDNFGDSRVWNFSSTWNASNSSSSEV